MAYKVQQSGNTGSDPTLAGGKQPAEHSNGDGTVPGNGLVIRADPQRYCQNTSKREQAVTGHCPDQRMKSPRRLVAGLPLCKGPQGN